MNDLILSIAKERILPSQIGVIEYPNSHFENQLYHLAMFMSKDLLDTYVQFSRLNYPEDVILELTLMHNFPFEWLQVARQSRNYHIRFDKILETYTFTFPNEVVTEMQKVVEFLCYEIIETSVIRSNFQPITSLIPCWLLVGIRSDPILKSIVQKHQVILVPSLKTKCNVLKVNDPDILLSNKANRLLRAFVEEYIQRIFRSRNQPNQLTLSDVRKYFNEYRSIK